MTVRRDLFSLPVEAPVNPVNCVCAMGRGLALEFRRRGRVRPSRMFVTEIGTDDDLRWIVNFPTRRHWRNRNRLADIDAGLRNLAGVIGEPGIRSLAVPALGCRPGGLRWNSAQPLIKARLSVLSDDVVVYVEPPLSEGG